METPARVIVFISGRGSNLKSLIDQQGRYTVVAVISNKPSAPGLQFAIDADIETIAYDRSEFPSVVAHKKALFEAANRLKPDLIALAGYMQILSADFVTENYGKIVNIHPALLPSYPGLDTHRRVLESDDSQHGCSVHYVDAGVDTGPIIAQAACDLAASDTEESLAAKILKLEHQIYPWVLSQIAGSEIHLDGRRVVFSDKACKEARALGFLLPPA